MSKGKRDSYTSQFKFQVAIFSLRLGAFLGKKVEFFDMPYDALIMALESGRIAVSVAYMDATPERKESTLFSKDYIDGSVAAMILKKNYSGSCYASLAELKGKRIGTLTGSAYEDLARGHLPEYKPISFSQLNQAITALENRIADASTSERVKLNKQLQKLQAQATESLDYEEKIHHLADQMIKIDLDDGVKVNYAKFKDVLAKIG